MPDGNMTLTEPFFAPEIFINGSVLERNGSCWRLICYAREHIIGVQNGPLVGVAKCKLIIPNDDLFEAWSRTGIAIGALTKGATYEGRVLNS